MVGHESVRDFARTAGDDWEVITGTNFDLEWADYQAATFMHELGHTLGLTHGGNDGREFKPHYLSVMSYAYQFNNGGEASWLPGAGPRARTERPLGFSHGWNSLLVESLLDEGAGIGAGNPGWGRLIYSCDQIGQPCGRRLVGPTFGAVNWNGSSEDPSVPDGSVAIDIDSNSVLESLSDHDDWWRASRCADLPDPTGGLGSGTLQRGAVAAPDELTVGEYFDGVLGSEDRDGDAILNVDDLCPLVPDPNPLQDNIDGDPYGDGCDCNPSDANNWTSPSSARRVVFADESTLTWSPPIFLGATSVVYDVLQSVTPMDFDAGGACAVTNNSGTSASVFDTPLSDQVYFYLVRAESACAAGEGLLGADSYGVSRTGVSCD